MKISDKRFLTTHMGSLPRVGGLADLLVAKESGQSVDEDALDAAIKIALQTVVDQQLGSGVDVVNNGEVARTTFVDYITERMDGFSRGPGTPRPLPLDAVRFPVWFENISRGERRRINVYDFPHATGELRYTNFAPLKAECEGLAACLADASRPCEEAFMTAVSPGFAATALMNVAYDSHEDYVHALSRELKVEYEYIVEQGFVLQIDSPDLGMERQGFFQDQSLEEFKKSMEMHIGALNDALAGIPPERVRLHACWGNRDGPHVHDVPCPEILPILYQAKVGAICLPFANARHQHEIEAFRTQPLPADMVLVAGVIESTNNYVEHPEVVAERIARAADCVGDPQRVIAGTDCGFGTLAGDTFTAEDVVWAKLEALSEGARLASARLF